ncbi:hypothetical protein CRG98_033744 [Punica granatum]|uniref:Tf2-1-like SH3-like domain-containing protein n=1 Tax=Punica granatum TaxID=22663 RepID=A0A2I0IPD4_PUNGR|nr:hypothetical protein CRG98_033744 [Punica granatum]
MTIRGRILSTQGRMMRQKTWGRHVEFEVGDFVWAVLTKDRFSAGDYHKPAARKIGPVEIVEKINSNVYRLKLPSHIRTADVFNVKHLIPYTGVADRRRRHVEFEVGDFVWAVLTKDRFSAGHYYKHAARKIGPAEIVEKINSNAYRLKLPSNIPTADVFNVKHLIPYPGDSSDDDDSRRNSLHPKENDAAEDLSFRALSNLGFEFDAYFLVFVELTGVADRRRRHVEFEVGDFVWAVLTKDRFSAGHYYKHAARKIGPAEIVEKINSNAYRLKLPSNIPTADVFNVKHLIPYPGDSSDDDDSRRNSLHPKENDAAEDLSFRALSNLGFEFDAYFLVFVELTGVADRRRRHVEFEVGDFVWAVLTKDRFSAGHYYKHAARKIGPAEIVEKINSNAYRLKLPSNIPTADVFNVKHLIPYPGDSSDDDDSRRNSLHPKENDAAEDLSFRALSNLGFEFDAYFLVFVELTGVADRRRRHVEFEVGDFVWAVLTKDRFSAGHYYKHAARKIGPAEIVEKINSNAYRLKLPSNIPTADVFNVKHLIPYPGDSSDDDDSRTNSFHPGSMMRQETWRRHVEFEVGDFVWAVLTKDRFSAGHYYKLAARKIGPVEIVEKINSNADRLILPSHIRTADVFNVKHLIPYTGDSKGDDDSRTNSLHPGENDAAEDLVIARTMTIRGGMLSTQGRMMRQKTWQVGYSLDDDDSRTNSLHPGVNDAAEDLDRFSAGDYHKLAAIKIGPVEIVEKINSNAYRLKLPSNIRTADVFNVKHLIPYTGYSQSLIHILMTQFRRKWHSEQNSPLRRDFSIFKANSIF